MNDSSNAKTTLCVIDLTHERDISNDLIDQHVASAGASARSSVLKLRVDQFERIIKNPRTATKLRSQGPKIAEGLPGLVPDHFYVSAHGVHLIVLASYVYEVTVEASDQYKSELKQDPTVEIVRESPFRFRRTILLA